MVTAGRGIDVVLSGAMSLDVQIACDVLDVPPTGDIRQWVIATYDRAQFAADRDIEITVRVVEEDEIRTLNRDFRQQDMPTNVLSFPPAPLSPAPDHQSPVHPLNAAAHDCVPGGGAETFLGDIILSAETVMREADEQDKAPAHHFQHLVLHGLLHLLGFDHESEADATEMEQLEIELLQSLNIRNPYGDCA